MKSCSYSMCVSPCCRSLANVECLPVSLLQPVAYSHSLALASVLFPRTRTYLKIHRVYSHVWIRLLDVMGILKSEQTWLAENTCSSLFCSYLMLFLILVNYLNCLFESKQMGLGSCASCRNFLEVQKEAVVSICQLNKPM